MSGGQIPREPRFFPRMKYRAAKRHERAAFGYGHCWYIVYDEVAKWATAEWPVVSE